MTYVWLPVPRTVLPHISAIIFSCIIFTYVYIMQPGHIGGYLARAS